MMMIAVHSSWSWRIIFMPFVLCLLWSLESCEGNTNFEIEILRVRKIVHIAFMWHFVLCASGGGLCSLHTLPNYYRLLVLCCCVASQPGWRQERWEMMVLFCEKLLLMKSRLELCLNLSLVTRSSIPLSSDTLNFKMNFPCSRSNGLEFLFTAMTEINLSHSSLAPDKSSVDGIRVCLTCA